MATLVGQVAGGRRWTGHGRHVSTRGATWLVLACVALALRLPDLGNPLIDLDEQMYLLVGDRMWQGALPYVDIWDRKPIGLFLIYAAARAPGGDPYVGYQLLALVAALATAGVIAALARRVTGTGTLGGILAGAVYLVWISLIGGRGGQAPVFYDPLIAVAALCTWRALSEEPGRWRFPLLAMLLAGLALQVKPTVVFEGVFFGLALLASAWWRHRSPERIAGHAAALVVVALGPTLLAFAAYAALGHADAWWFANVRSIFLRGVTMHEPVADRLLGLGLILGAPLAAALLGLSRAEHRAKLFLGGWLAAAIGGVLMIPPYYNHYALPLLVPVAALAGPALASRGLLAIGVGIVATALLLYSGYPHPGETVEARRRIAGLAAMIERHRPARRCLFLFQAPPVLYQQTESCLPTRYPFAPHLTFAGEARAIGVDPVAEVRRVLADRPPVIVTMKPDGDVNHATFALVAAALRERYTRVGGDLGYGVYALRPGPRPAGNP